MKLGLVGCVALLVACDVQPEVVAELGSRSAQRSQARCEGDTSSILLLDEDGRLLRWWPVPSELASVSAPGCLAPDVRAGAVDQTGRVWINRGGAIWRFGVTDDACEAVALPLDLRAMAFVYDPARGYELLYGIADQVLFAIDPISLRHVALGALDAAHLIGTSRGALFALTEPAPHTIRLSRVDLEDVALRYRAEKNDAAVVGVAAWQTSIRLVYERMTQRLDPLSEDPASNGLPTNIVKVFASDCWPSLD